MKALLSSGSNLLVAEGHLEIVVMARRKCPSFYSGIFLIGFAFVVLGFWWLAPFQDSKLSRTLASELQSDEKVVLMSSSPHAEPRDTNCTYHNFTCLEVYHCGYDDSTTISVYIYPIQQYYDENGNDITPPMSREFEEMLQVIAESPYHSHDPETACLFIPSIDLLNENLLNQTQVSQILASLKWWNEGKNHLLINMLPGRAPDYKTFLGVNSGKAMVAGGGFSSWTYRRTFDVTIPLYNPLLEDVELSFVSYTENRKWFLLSTQFGLNSEYKSKLKALSDSDSDVVLLDRCEGHGFNYSERCDYLGKEYSYPAVLQNSTFCLVLRGNRLGQPSFLDALKAKCIPVVVADGFLLPFHEVLDWTRAAVTINEEQLPEVLDVLKNFSRDRIISMRRQLQYFWQRYFSSLSDITLTMLQILNDRVFPFDAHTYDQWNELPNKKAIKNPLFLPLRAPKSLGFTAVILTYDRVDSLFQVVRQVGKVPSLAKVIVVWNNQEIQPPAMSKWPNIGKPIKVIQTKFNRLSNRFFPYDEIETECILALDDDIIMLTADEMEFGYEVWRENPDRLVGYPSRLHLWQNETQSYSYESEWMNSISMVLTGAAFHHKYFSFMYTYGMPGNLRQWVDDHINCEDIAMNFLVTNITGKAPIKVVPRKKFKCPECVKEMLSADTSHMVERSECINCFEKLYGSMPLKAIEFRADPVLYKDKFPGVLMKFSNLGTL
ncbi:exostosin-2 [Aplysia californica]|uniref:Exostosin-2 n=1 Tax=Aplysia californica TaxID=6500 RepID=A0ABM1VSE9_APLCA|nr:exostosin-2 [Aplysia californica]XP_035825341.1 exostosin-2 [Aplysia californica]XP_035825342.1 exostosin-2 [Aplysia californica]